MRAAVVNYLKYVFFIRNLYVDRKRILYLNTKKIFVFEYLKYAKQTQIQFRLTSSLYLASQQLTAAAEL